MALKILLEQLLLESNVRNTIIDCLKEKKLCTIRYNDENPTTDRVIEPYAYGLTNRRNYAVRAYQTNGPVGGKTNTSDGWRLFRIDKILNAQMSDQDFIPNRPLYNPNDKGMPLGPEHRI